MRCPSLEEVVRGLRGRTLSFEALAYRCGWEGALRLIAAAAIKIRADGERGSVVCVRTRSLWACDAKVFGTFCVPQSAAVEAIRRALRAAEEAGIKPLWAAPLRKRKTNCWTKEDAERLVEVLLDGLAPTKGRRRQIYRGI
jgi:FAD/FMN-containing dehydrogenase